LEVGAQGVAGVGGAGEAFAGFAQEGVILGGEEGAGTLELLGGGVGQDGGKEVVNGPIDLGEEAIVVGPVLVGMAQPAEGAGDGLGAFGTEEGQGQLAGVGAGPGVGRWRVLAGRKARRARSWEWAVDSRISRS
jgi:hypothetical protein